MSARDSNKKESLSINARSSPYCLSPPLLLIPFPFILTPSPSPSLSLSSRYPHPRNSPHPYQLPSFLNHKNCFSSFCRCSTCYYEVCCCCCSWWGFWSLFFCLFFSFSIFIYWIFFLAEVQLLLNKPQIAAQVRMIQLKKNRKNKIGIIFIFIFIFFLFSFSFFFFFIYLAF